MRPCFASKLETAAWFPSVLHTLASEGGRSGARKRRRRVVQSDLAPHYSTRPIVASLVRTSGSSRRAGPSSLLHCTQAPRERAHASQMSDDASATPPPPKQEERTSCWLELDALYSCATPKHQFEVVYRDGTFDDCQQRAADMWACMRGGAARRRAEAAAAGEAIEKEAPHVWELKERPSWTDEGQTVATPSPAPSSTTEWSLRRWWSSRGAS